MQPASKLLSLALLVLMGTELTRSERLANVTRRAALTSRTHIASLSSSPPSLSARGEGAGRGLRRSLTERTRRPPEGGGGRGTCFACTGLSARRSLSASFFPRSRCSSSPPPTARVYPPRPAPLPPDMDAARPREIGMRGRCHHAPSPPERAE
ncbi:hypothetical protein GN956_G19449 [Arapaima gigas]